MSDESANKKTLSFKDKLIKEVEMSFIEIVLVGKIAQSFKPKNENRRPSRW